MAEYVKTKLGHVRVEEAAMFVFETAKYVPRVLRLSLALPLFVLPYLAAKCVGGVGGGLGGVTKEEILARLCMSAEDVAMVCQFGKATGTSSWMSLRNRDSQPLLLRHLTRASAVGSKSAERTGVGLGGEGEAHGSGDEEAEVLTEEVIPGCYIAKGSVAVAAPLTEEAIHEQKQEKELLWRDALLDLDTAISRAVVGGDADDDLEIHPDTLSVCESVRAKFGLNVKMESDEVKCVFLSDLQRIANRSIQYLA